METLEILMETDQQFIDSMLKYTTGLKEVTSSLLKEKVLTSNEINELKGKLKSTENIKNRIKERIKKLYQQQSEEYPKRLEGNEDFALTRYALTVLVDIYTYEEGMEEDNRLIYHDWDVIEPTIQMILEEDKL